jgi:hypothetical protein
MTSKKKTFKDYDTEEKRTIALRIYVNEGEKQLIDDAIRVTERIPDRSAWASKVLLREACRVLGIDFPYGR